MLEGAKELNTLTSKKALIQKFWAFDVKPCPFFCVGAIEGEALSSQGLQSRLLANIWAHLCWRCAVMSRMRSCQMDGKAPLGQLKAWSMGNSFPDSLHGKPLKNMTDL